MSDRIQIRELEVLAFCGVLPEEHQRRQPFTIDVDLIVDLAPAGRSDDLDDTVNYGELIDRLVALAAESRFNLLEAMAQAVADIALTYPLVSQAEVTVRKLRPPVEANVATTGVSIVRNRAGD